MNDADTPHAGARGNAESTDRGTRQYRSPELIEYGSIAKLTQGNRSTMADGPTGGFNKGVGDSKGKGKGMMCL
jgi:hypothetical protein